MILRSDNSHIIFMMIVSISGAFNATKGDAIKITEAYFQDRINIRAPSIENITTGEIGSFGKPMMTIPLTLLNPPIIGHVEKLERKGSETIITLDEISKEVFLSYSTEDKHLAGKIKVELEKIGIRSFLAHEEIDVSSVWRAEIRKHLNACDLFLPIVTDNFNKSSWANQESGHSFANHKTIIPLIFDETRITGLIEELQGIKMKRDNITSDISKLVSEIKKSHPFLLK